MNYNNFRPLVLGISLLAAVSTSQAATSETHPDRIVSTATEPIAQGPFKASWDSLSAYSVPEWFRDAKFGIWAHWGPQCQPEVGDWYARLMYGQGEWQYKFHLEHYGHPSEFGFKDVIHEWKAQAWDPERLMALYKSVGAKYFFALANHHDNFDLWASKYQPWNSTRVGPMKDLISGWARAARAQGLPFGVSVHAAHAWSWYETAQASDATGDKAGIPYDGKLTAADGKGKWWDGLDPQDLYAQNHTPSPNFQTPNSIFGRWEWGNGCSVPDLAYCQKFYDRVADLINQAQPDLIYFDDTVLPLWPISDAGLKITAHFYNSHLAHKGSGDAGVLFGKILNDEQRKCLVWDIERGIPPDLLPYPWQTDTCLGEWHYSRSAYEEGRYKTAKTVIHMLVDIVSKNGNLLLNVPLRGDGSIDDKEEAILGGIRSWMSVNGEAIFATRPWKIFGEGPMTRKDELKAQGFNEGNGTSFKADDVRYTVSKDGRTVYIIALGAPGKALSLKGMGRETTERPIENLTLLGGKTSISWKQTATSLVIDAPEASAIDAATPAVVFKATLAAQP